MAGDRDVHLKAAIEAAKQQYDRDNPPGPDALPRDQWQVVPDEGHRAYFTEAEVARGGEIFLPPQEAAAFARELYADPEGFFLPEDALSALSMLSEDMAERVRLLLHETQEQANGRVEEFRARLGTWHVRGSPRDDFPTKDS